MEWRILNSLDLSGAPEAIAALEEVGTQTRILLERGKRGHGFRGPGVNSLS